MTVLRIYCKSHRRQPVCPGSRFPFRDRQADIPVGWCPHCGTEIFRTGERLCQWCQQTKGET